MTIYIEGDIIEATGTFTAVDTNLPIDPTTVQFFYTTGPTADTQTAPGTTLSYTGGTNPAPGAVVKTAEGTYVAQVDTTGMGQAVLFYEWKSTGSGQCASPRVRVTINAAMF